MILYVFKLGKTEFKRQRLNQIVNGNPRKIINFIANLTWVMS